MNVSRLVNLRTLILLGFLPFLAVFDASAQGNGSLEYHSLEVNIGDTLYWDFYSDPPYKPKIDQYGVFPKHGTADLPGSGPLGVNGWNTLTYIPNTSVPVRDTVFIKYWKWENGNYFSVHVTLDIKVVPSIIHANDDYVETVMGASVVLDVLANDWGNGDTIRVEDIPLHNHCSVTLNADQTLATITPAPGFSGLAHFIYTICDEEGTCDAATVTIAVTGPVPPALDTLQLSVPKNRSREILYPLEGYTLLSGPSNGTIDSTSADYPIYVPNPDYVNGVDHFIYSKTDNNGSFQLDVFVDVLDIAELNTFVFDDFYETSIEQSVFFNVLDNDLGGQNLKSVAVVNAPDHGSVQFYGNGNFEYTPDPGFEGVDHFVYRAFTPNYSDLEYGDVYVTVSNFEPAQATFELTTPMDVPLIIGYNIPIDAYNFEIVVDPSFGTLEYHDGYHTLTINGQDFSGYNMLVYTPNPGVVDVVDKFEIDYCVTGDNCPTAETKIDVEIVDISVSPDQFCLGENCVWAGDTNIDGVVNMKDLLPIGMCVGEVGMPRTDVDLSQWFGQYGEDWLNINDDPGFNLKHIDADGNGIIGGTDTLGINQFYLNQHTLVAEPPADPIDVPLYFYQSSIDSVENGDLVTLDIWLGDPSDQLAIDIYGFAFTLTYDAALVDENSVHINFLNESWLSYNSPVLHMTKKPITGRVDAGITRTTGYSENGYGIVATMDFVVIEDIEGNRLLKDYIQIELEDIVAMNSAGESLPLKGQTIRIPIKQSSAEDENVVEEKDLRVFPNPAQDQVTVYLNGEGNLMDQIGIYNTTGQEIYFQTSLERKYVSLDVSNWTTGMYFVQMIAEDGTLITKKLEIIK